MLLAREIVDARVRSFQAACEQAGIKVTHQRLAIFRAVIETEDHPDVISVHRRVKQTIPTVSLDTVYRNLRLLAEHRLISIVGMSQENVRFDGNIDPHHHFTCMKCGLIRDFTADELGRLDVPEVVKNFGAPISLHLEVKGLCRRCQEESAGK